MTDAMKMIEELERWQTKCQGRCTAAHVKQFHHLLEERIPLLLCLARRGIEAEKVVEIVSEYLDGGNIIAPDRIDTALAAYKETTNGL